MENSMKPTRGRIVLYSLAEDDLPDAFRQQVGRTRPAIVVETWGNEKYEPTENSSAVNLQVFVDGANDGFPTFILWRTSVLYSGSPRPGCWSWPPRSE
jgi:hypothetical protein